jgi:KaiC/GvpD/RAD55 family RecA-like ATPase
MLTIFGRKKKEGENKDVASTGPTQQDPSQVPERSTALGPSPNTPVPPAPTQESRFAKIFNSVSQDYQSQRPSRPEGVTTSMSATPEYVQPRTLPPSKPMIITPHGARTSRDGEGWEEKGGQQGPGQIPPPQTQQKPTTIPTAPTSRSPTQIGAKDVPRPLQRAMGQSSIQQAQSAPVPVPPQQPQPQASPKVPSPPSNRPSPPFTVKETPKSAQKSEDKPVTQPSPTISLQQSAKTKEKEEAGSSSDVDSKGESSDSPISFNESPSYDFGGFDDLSKLLAETDSALALGREKEKEFTVEKPTKVEKALPKKEPEKKEEKPTQAKQVGDKAIKSFDHLFDLTQGGLDAPGFVVINGPATSGKTTVCFGLVDRYLKQGSPCLFVSYGQSPAKVRDGLKQLGCNASEYESNYRLMIFDGYTAQSGGFSLELYGLLEPWDLAKVQESIVGNSGIFMGEKVKVIIDSIDALCGRNGGGREFGKQFDVFVGKLKETGATVIASCDLDSLGKEVKSWAEDGADCLLELEAESGKSGGKEYSLKVARLKGDKVKADAEEFEIQAGKGLVFV